MYETPSLNDSLYLHSLSIAKISLLPDYTHIQFLSLDQNQIREMSWLQQFVNLRYLMLDNNLIDRLDISPATIPSTLEQLHISSNQISHIEISPDSAILSLTLLKLRKNKLQHFPCGLGTLTRLEIIDIAENYIQEEHTFRQFLKHEIPKSVRQIYVSPNPFVGKIRNYRRLVLSEFTGERLSFLDTKFVTEEELEIAKSNHPDQASEIRKKFAKNRRQELQSRVDGLRQLGAEFNCSASDSIELCRELLSLATQVD